MFKFTPLLRQPMSHLSTLKRYLNYLWKGKTRYWIHSPFLFNFVNEVLGDNRQFYAYAEIEQWIGQLKEDKQLIQVDDHGAGSKKLKSYTRAVGDIAATTAIPTKYGRLLFRLVDHFEVRTILELGTGLGISTAYMAKANTSAKLYTLEGSPAVAAKASDGFSTLGLDNIQVVTGVFEDTLASTLDELEPIDLVYLDGDHRKEAVLNNFNLILPKLHNNSIVVIDDINWSDGMHEAWQQVSHHQQVTLSIDLFRCGILFFRKEMAPKHKMLYF